MQKIVAVVLALSVSCCWTADLSAANGWSPVIIATGPYRHQLQSLPIERRPNRPLHFYGNAVRRSHARNQSAKFASPAKPSLLRPLSVRPTRR